MASINGDDSIELVMNDSSIEVFDIGTDGTGELEYLDSRLTKLMEHGHMVVLTVQMVQHQHGT